MGQSRTSVYIPINDDAVREGNEVFYVLLSVPSSAALVPGKNLIARVTIFGELSMI